MERSKQDRNEVPCGTGYQPLSARGPSLSETKSLYKAHREPINEYDALMQCDFMEEPEEPEDGAFLTETMACLTPKEQAVVNFVVMGDMSYWDAGRILGAEFPRKGIPKPYSKTTIGNIYNRAINKMRKHLEEQ